MPVMVTEFCGPKLFVQGFVVHHPKSRLGRFASWAALYEEGLPFSPVHPVAPCLQLSLMKSSWPHSLRSLLF